MFYLNSQLVAAYQKQNLRSVRKSNHLKTLSVVLPTYWDRLLYQAGNGLISLGERVREVSAYSHVKQGCV